MTGQERLRRERQSEADLARNASMTIPEWCAHRRVSRAQFYKLAGAGKAPRTYHVGSRRYISAEADLEWLRQRESEAA